MLRVKYFMAILKKELINFIYDSTFANTPDVLHSRIPQSTVSLRRIVQA